MSQESDASHDDAREPEKKEGKSEEVFEVEKILTHKLLDGRLFLKTRWAGFGPEEDTWEPEEDLQECANECVIEYFAKVNVKDGAELIARLQKKKSAKNHTANQKSKKRERPISSSDEDVSDNSDGSYKKKKSKKSKKSHRKSSPSASLEAPKVQTKAALKSYDSISSATSSGPSLPKQKAFLARSQYDQSSSEDEEDEPTVSFLDKIANKVKPKVTVQAPIELPVPPKSPQPETLTKPKIEVRSPSLEPTSSSAAHVSSKSTKKSDGFELNGRNKSLTGKCTSNEDAKDWKVDGIVRHSDDLHRRKLVLLTNSTTGERKVLDPKETFDLVGWSLTKYLLDRCEF